MVREEMIGAMKLDVPLDVEIAAGKNWLDVEDSVETRHGRGRRHEVC